MKRNQNKNKIEEIKATMIIIIKKKRKRDFFSSSTPRKKIDKGKQTNNIGEWKKKVFNFFLRRDQGFFFVFV